MLRLEEGQDIFEALTGFARKERIRAATVVFGIGMLGRATLGYWDGTAYQPHEVPTPHELVALHGTIAESDGEPSVHLHGGLAGPTGALIGGHLLKATVGVLAEILVDTFPGRTFERPFVESRGLRMLDLGPGTSV